jgi:pimeloyl-ACP methyl ester carboxylesterase
MLQDLLIFVWIGLGAIVVLALIAPLEALGWWAGWRQRQRYEPTTATIPVSDGEAAKPASQYVIFLSGIGDPSGRWHYPQETDFLNRLRQQLPDAAIISDLFAYAVTTRALDEQPRFQGLWARLNQTVQKNQYAPSGALINIRNLLQVAVSADHRYGPFYNLGQTENIVDALVAHGYRVGSGQRVVLIGYSGGGQVALGAAAYLVPVLRAPIVVISVGGVMNSEPGCLQVEHVYHLQGAKDPIHRIGDGLFFGRWPLARTSAWNRALRQGKITLVPMDEMAHNGDAGYFGITTLASGQPHVERTLEVMLPLITGQDHPEPGDAPAAASHVEASVPSSPA